MKNFFYAIAALIAVGITPAQANPEAISTRYEFAQPQAQRAVRYVARQFTSNQIKNNAKAIITAPIDGVDAVGQWLLRRVGTNQSGFTCLGCGREQRLAALANGKKDCAGGDHVYGWLDPKCTTPAPVGAVNALRITPSHIERVVGRCESAYAPVKVVDGNGVGGVNSVRCVSLYGATYRYNIDADGSEAPLYMQPDPCRGRGPQPRHWI